MSNSTINISCSQLYYISPILHSLSYSPRGAHQAGLLQLDDLARGLGVAHVLLELGGVAALQQDGLQRRVHQHGAQFLVLQDLNTDATQHTVNTQSQSVRQRGERGVRGERSVSI